MRLLSIFFSLLFISGCKNKFTPPEGFVELKDSEPRASSLGFSFLPPTGGKWFEGYSTKTIMYLKQTNHNEVSLFAGATEAEIKENITSKDEFIDFIKARKEDFSNAPNRYKNIVSNYSLDGAIAPYCITYKQTAHDYEAKNLNGNEYLVLTNKGVACLHPETNKYLIDIYYSYRAVPSLKQFGFTQEVEDFINSLKFSKGGDHA